jgi:hypothetical protein
VLESEPPPIFRISSTKHGLTVADGGDSSHTFVETGLGENRNQADGFSSVVINALVLAKSPISLGIRMRGRGRS